MRPPHWDPVALNALRWNPERPEGVAMAFLRAQGYTGKRFRDLSQDAWNDHQDREHERAEADCRGRLLNPAGYRLGVHPRSLFGGNWRFARCYASRELLDWWAANRRVTADEYRLALLGRDGRPSGSGRW